ncbi:chemoreceptor glutamine deamidase CheD [Shewanella waksmanii]|uniref:chemoreceptor glutamine deamidase CheD n=1 Tax=Shewanella waksmanii TaxID=213783 RepID=UPI003735194B
MSIAQAATPKTYNSLMEQINSTPLIRVVAGDLYSTKHHEFISTGLGSCIAACIWDPVQAIGGMNHFLLPTSQTSHEEALLSVPGRYGDNAMELLVHELLELGAQRTNLKVKIFGGAVIKNSHNNIGEQNSRFVLDYCARQGLEVLAKDIGAASSRRIIFSPQTGQVWMKRIAIQSPSQYPAVFKHDSIFNHCF